MKREKCADVCKHAPPGKKWPCVDCDMRYHDRAEPITNADHIGILSGANVTTAPIDTNVLELDELGLFREKMSKTTKEPSIYIWKEAIYLCDDQRDIAKHVTRISVDGIMFSDTGIDGPYRYLKPEHVVDGQKVIVSIPGVTGPIDGGAE